MKIVLNTSPVIFLSKIDCLHYLADCFDDIFVPNAVVQELREDCLPAFITISKLSATGSSYVAGALGRLHQGELEAMVLAQELAADFVALDDLLARRKAQRLGLNVIGTVGLLLLLVKQNLIAPETTWLKLKQLTEQHGLYLSPHLLEQINTLLFKRH